MRETVMKMAVAYGKVVKAALAIKQPAGHVKRKPRLFVLAFHRVLPDDEPALRPSLAISESSFREIVELVRRRFFVLSPSEVVPFLQGDLRPANDAVLFTFDDGYADNWHHAAPILKEAGIKAVFHITTGFVAGTHPMWWDVLLTAAQTTAVESVPEASEEAEANPVAALAREMALLPVDQRLEQANRLVGSLKKTSVAKRMAFVRQLAEVWSGGEALKRMRLPKALTWQQVAALHRQGHEIGAHTVSHADLDFLSPDEIREEIVGSVLALERVTKTRVRMFAYPTGDPAFESKRRATFQILRETGIEVAFSTKEGWNVPGDSAFLVRRVNMTDTTLVDRNSRFSEDCFYAVLGGFFRKGKRLWGKVWRRQWGRR